MKECLVNLPDIPSLSIAKTAVGLGIGNLQCCCSPAGNFGATADSV